MTSPSSECMGVFFFFHFVVLSARISPCALTDAFSTYQWILTPDILRILGKTFCRKLTHINTFQKIRFSWKLRFWTSQRWPKSPRTQKWKEEMYSCIWKMGSARISPLCAHWPIFGFSMDPNSWNMTNFWENFLYKTDTHQSLPENMVFMKF